MSLNRLLTGVLRKVTLSAPEITRRARIQGANPKAEPALSPRSLPGVIGKWHFGDTKSTLRYCRGDLVW